MDTLPSLPPPTPSMLLRFLPVEATDPFGRPVLVVRSRHLSGLNVTDLKNQLLTMYELARLHIADLTQNGEEGKGRVIQFVVIIDLQGLSVRSVVSPTSIRIDILLGALIYYV